MPNPNTSITWPLSKLNTAVAILVQKAGFISSSIFKFDPPLNADDLTLNRWFEYVTYQSGMESVAVDSPYSDIDDMIRNAGPAILRVDHNSNTPRFFVILKGGWKYIHIISPDLKMIKIPPVILKQALCEIIETPEKQSIYTILDKIDIPESQKKSACDAMLLVKLKSEQIGGCWLLRLSPGANFIKWFRHLCLPKYFISMITCEAICQICMILSWLIIGKMVFDNTLDLGRFIMWALMLVTVIPFKLYSQWSQCQISMNTGSYFKQRLLFGAMFLKQDDIRNQGTGQFMGRVMESESFESMALDGGFDTITFLIYFTMAIWLFAIGCGGTMCLVFMLWIIGYLFCYIVYANFLNTWVNHYRDMTNKIIERMVGYRTRIVQEIRKKWHEDEDIELNEYHHLSEKVDRMLLVLNPILTRGWMVVSIACLVFLQPDSKESLLISIGGIIIAYQGLGLLYRGMSTFVLLLCSWKQVKPLYHAASRYVEEIPKLTLSKNIIGPQNAFIDMQDVTYKYENNRNFKLDIPKLKIDKTDRILFEGPSGGGKSTLASIISGARQPDTGVMLYHGLDAQFIGSAMWRRNIVLSPQFHENYIFSASFAFNLFMGRGWPPCKKDFIEAKALCGQLGLDELLEKMPEGFEQMIGEGGWQLSHGEQSRIFIARAILQKPELLIFDESFMPLDPENFEKVLNCILKNNAGIIVVAHL